MMRPSQQIRHQQRLAIFNFFALIVLLFAGQSGVSAQGSVNLKVEEGKQIRSSVSFTNDCVEAQSYRIAPTKYVRLEGATTIVINGRSTVTIGFVFDAAGLEPNVYSDRIGLISNRNKERPLAKRTTIKKNLQCRSSDCELLPNCKGQCKEEPVTTVCKGKNNVISIEITVTEKAVTPTPTPKIVVKTSPTKVTPPVTPTETPTEALGETPTDTSPATMSPVETPVTPTPAMEAEVSQKPSPPEPAFVKYLKYPVLISALVFVLSLSTLGGKNLLDKRKYGKNALQNLSSLKKAIHVKEQLSQNWMKKSKTQNLHAIGVGKTGAAGGYCIQLFVENANGEMPENPPIHLLPEKYRQFPIAIYEMPRAEFLAGNENHGCQTKECHDTIIGGISGANTNLANEYGTIGYFCAPTILRPIRKFRKEVYLLSNSHVFADLNKPKKDDNDLIQQPSPGENKRHNFIASLENYVPLLFDNDTENPNYIDAAIARLFQGKAHRLEIPVIGKINDFVPKEKVEINQECRKFGRTTGYTEGEVFSIHLSIWIRYAATGQESFFKEQFLIIPTGSHNDFVKGGDSGSLVADGADKAIGLVFAGANSDRKFNLKDLPDVDAESLLAAVSTEKIRSFGVANPISEVLKGLNVKLML
jgi:hypothetical protein